MTMNGKGERLLFASSTAHGKPACPLSPTQKPRLGVREALERLGVEEYLLQ